MTRLRVVLMDLIGLSKNACLRSTQTGVRYLIKG
jgi:hypothetical protein